MKLVLAVVGLGLWFNTEVHGSERTCSAARAQCFKACEASLQHARSRERQPSARRQDAEMQARRNGRRFIECQHDCNGVFVRCR